MGADSASAVLNARGTFLNFTSSMANPDYGQDITLTAAATASLPWNPVPTGSASLFEGTTPLGTANLAAGTAQFTVSNLNAGSHVLSTIYAGDANFQPHGSASLTQKINPATTTTVLGSSANPSLTSQAVDFAVTVTPAYSGSPSGTVTFYDGATTLGTATLAAGTATIGASALAAGTHSITAGYGGDSNFTGSTSPVLSQVVNQQDFSVEAAPFSGPIRAGASSTSTITITSLFGFTDPVALTCSVSPSQLRAPTCSLNPASISPAPGGAVSTLTVSTTARPDSGPIYALWLPVASLAFMGIVVAPDGSRKHRRLGMLLGCLLLAALAFQPGCGGGSSAGGGGTPGTPAGAYTITLSGTSGSGGSVLTHQTTVTLTVQ
jgi:hypothetical protein